MQNADRKDFMRMSHSCIYILCHFLPLVVRAVSHRSMPVMAKWLSACSDKYSELIIIIFDM